LQGVASYLHGDQLGSVRMITSATGTSAKQTTYRPFGEAVEHITDASSAPETKGFIGEHYDADAAGGVYPAGLVVIGCWNYLPSNPDHEIY